MFQDENAKKYVRNTTPSLQNFSDACIDWQQLATISTSTLPSTPNEGKWLHEQAQTRQLSMATPAPYGHTRVLPGF
jgi:hypothetical protein